MNERINHNLEKMEIQYGLLKGIEIPKPKYMKYTIPNELQLKNYNNLKTFIPPMKQLFDISGYTDITFENDFIIKNIEEKNGSYFLNKNNLDATA